RSGPGGRRRGAVEPPHGPGTHPGVLPAESDAARAAPRLRRTAVCARAGLGTGVSTKRSLLPDSVEQYVAGRITAETPLQRRLRKETAALPEAGMQIGPDQGALLALLIRLLGARRVL